MSGPNPFYMDAEECHHGHITKAQIMWNCAKMRANKKGMQFNIAISDIIIPEFCPVLGIKLGLNNRKPSDNSPTLDRIDNSKGYVKGNVMVISHRANIIKSNATVDELGQIYSFYKRLRENKYLVHKYNKRK